MRRNGYLWTSGVNLDTAVRFPDPDFLIECKISAIWRRFPLIFCILYADCPPYFYFRFVWPTDLESILHASTPTSIIPTKFEVDMTTHCRVIAFCLLIRHVTLWLWPLTFWPWTVAVHGESRNQPWHQVCAESRDPWVGGQKQLHFWNPRPRFAYSLYNFYWATTTISPLQATL